MSKRYLLIDGDIFLYKAAAVCEQVFDWNDDGIYCISVDVDKVFDIVSRQMKALIEELKADDVLLCFTSGRNFRKKILPDYKSHRRGLRKPIAMGPVRVKLAEAFRCKEIEGLEADDVMGILQTKMTQDTIIVSIDKDLQQIPGKLYHPDTKEMQIISPELGAYMHQLQTLMGDSTDGYKGCPKVGPVKAAAILHKAADPWAAVWTAYTKAGILYENMIKQAQVAHILQNKNYQDGKVILWTPPTNS